MRPPAPIRRCALVLLALCALLGEGLRHEGHHGHGLGQVGGGHELHDGSCHHLPAMHAEGQHECLVCQSGPTWLLTNAPRHIQRVAAGIGIRHGDPGVSTPLRREGPPLGPRGPPAIG